MPNPLGFLYTFEFVLVVAAAGIFYKGAELENKSGLLWMGLSLGVSMLLWRVLGWGWLGILIGQVGLGIAIAAVRAWRDFR